MSHITRLLPFLSLLPAILLTLAGCAGGSGPAGQNPEMSEGRPLDLLRPGDSLTVEIQGVPDPSQNQRQIDDSGRISLPFIGSMEAAGLTPSALSEKIRHTYIEKDVYRQLDVSVAVNERYLYIGGEVERPGRVVWTPDLTLTKAIHAAGGFTLYAAERNVRVTRDRETYTYNVQRARELPAEDPVLNPGDAIHVPRSAF